MTACEKCWNDAFIRELANPIKSQSEHYQDLIIERAENPCTPEEQAGPDAELCLLCGRFTKHQYTRKCVNPDCL